MIIKMMRIAIPDDVELILNALERNGFEAYIVGGCVRDSILGLAPHDWDICTSALPEQIKAVFGGHRQILSGEKHGTVGVIVGDVVYEVTTFRSDGQYSDSRHPDSVVFQTDVREDLLRRDFTINAMAYSDERGLVDPYNGIQDLKDGLIRCVGNAEDRFSEDPLRVLRALRFSVRYEFEIESDTFMAALNCGKLLRNISIERVNSEVSQILASNFTGSSSQTLAIEWMLYFIEKTLDDRVQFGGVTKLTDAICNCVDIMEVRLALMCDYCYDRAKDAPVRPDALLTELRFSNHVVQAVDHIVEYGVNMLVCLGGFVSFDGVPTFATRRVARLIGVDQARMALFFVEAKMRLYGELDENSIFNVLKQLDILEHGDCVYKLSQLAVNGNDMLALGYQGKQVGGKLELLLYAVTSGCVANERAALLEYAKKST